MFQFGGWHEADNYFLRLTCFNLEADMGLACLNLKAGNYFLRLTISIWTNWEADNFFLRLIISIWTNWRLTIIFWGWHGADMRLTCFNLEADIHVLRLTHFTLNQLEADNYFLRLTHLNLNQLWGWQFFFQSLNHFNLDHLKDCPFWLLSLISVGFFLLWILPFLFFPFWTTLFLNQLQSVSIWTLVVFPQTVSNWLDFNHGPVWNPAIPCVKISRLLWQILSIFITCMIHLDTLTMIRPMEAPFLMTSMSHNHHYQIWSHQFRPRYRGPCQNAI